MKEQKIFMVEFQKWDYDMFMQGAYSAFVTTRFFFSTEDAAKEWIKQDKQEQEVMQEKSFRRNCDYKITEEHFIR